MEELAGLVRRNDVSGNEGRGVSRDASGCTGIKLHGRQA